MASILSKLRGGTRSERLRRDTDQYIRHIMRGIAANPIGLAEVVAGGPHNFRLMFLREGRGFAVNEHIANMVFKFFCEQFLRRHPGQTAKQFLDAVEPVTPPTQKDIDESWEHHCDSGEEARRAFYEDGNRDPVTGEPLVSKVHVRHN